MPLPSLYLPIFHITVPVLHLSRPHPRLHPRVSLLTGQLASDALLLRTLLPLLDNGLTRTAKVDRDLFRSTSPRARGALLSSIPRNFKRTVRIYSVCWQRRRQGGFFCCQI